MRKISGERKGDEECILKPEGDRYKKIASFKENAVRIFAYIFLGR